ncbi:MAG: hypothetical protein Tsb0016_25920 [Sphingomonadales bacterium]
MAILDLQTEPLAVDVMVLDTALQVVLDDGRELIVPLTWFPVLLAAPAAARQNWQFIGRGEGIHWPELDEDISIAGLLAGRGDQRKPRPVLA